VRRWRCEHYWERVNPPRENHAVNAFFIVLCNKTIRNLKKFPMPNIAVSVYIHFTHSLVKVFAQEKNIHFVQPKAGQTAFFMHKIHPLAQTNYAVSLC